LKWQWKDPAKPGSLLGFYFTSGLNSNEMFDLILTTLRGRLRKWSIFPLTLQGKILVANHLILSGLWYVLTLCAIEPTRLKHLQKLIIAFV
jgi:hypothetical protein